MKPLPISLDAVDASHRQLFHGLLKRCLQRWLQTDSISHGTLQELSPGRSGAAVFYMTVHGVQGGTKYAIVKWGRAVAIADEVNRGKLLRQRLQGTAGEIQAQRLLIPVEVSEEDDGEVGYGLYLGPFGEAFAGAPTKGLQQTLVELSRENDGRERACRIMEDLLAVLNYIYEATGRSSVDSAGEGRARFYLRHLPEDITVGVEEVVGTWLLGRHHARTVGKCPPSDLHEMLAKADTTVAGRGALCGDSVCLLGLEAEVVGQAVYLNHLTTPPLFVVGVEANNRAAEISGGSVNVHAPVEKTRHQDFKKAAEILYANSIPPRSAPEGTLLIGGVLVRDPFFRMGERLRSGARAFLSAGHGDLHPRNVLVAEGKCYLIDFALSSIEHEHPAMADVARLEVFILTDIAPPDLPGLLSLELRLWEEEHKPSPMGVEFAYEVLRLLRERAFQTLASSMDGAQGQVTEAVKLHYATCLYGEALRVLKLKDVRPYGALAAAVVASGIVDRKQLPDPATIQPSGFYASLGLACRSTALTETLRCLADPNAKERAVHIVDHGHLFAGDYVEEAVADTLAGQGWLVHRLYPALNIEGTGWNDSLSDVLARSFGIPDASGPWLRGTGGGVTANEPGFLGAVRVAPANGQLHAFILRDLATYEHSTCIRLVRMFAQILRVRPDVRLISRSSTADELAPAWDDTLVVKLGPFSQDEVRGLAHWVQSNTSLSEVASVVSDAVQAFPLAPIETLRRILLQCATAWVP